MSGSERRKGAGGELEELSEAIPPAYTEFVGRQLLAHVRGKVAA